jgi:hypothetical protein
MANLKISQLTDENAVSSADRAIILNADGTGAKWNAVSAEKFTEKGLADLGIVPQNRISTTTDPGVNDDGAGTNGTVHIVNDLWTNTTTDKSWICQDITATAAVWAQIDGGGGGGGSTTEKSIEDVIEGLAAATGPAALDEVLLRDVSGTDALIRSTPQQLVETAHTAMGIVPRKTTVTTIDPTASDDSSLGFAAGSWWWNTTLQTLWWARSVGVGAAVWDQVNAGGAGDLWSDPVDAVITPDADGTRDLGLTGTRFATAYVDDLNVTTNIVVGGTVDGRDVAADGALAASAMQDLVDDVTPQLGGDLDLNGNKIQGAQQTLSFVASSVNISTPSPAVTATPELINTHGAPMRVDLTGFTQARLQVQRGLTTNTNLKLGIRYQTGAPTTTYGDYSALGTSEVEIGCATASAFTQSAWIDLAAGAKADDISLAMCWMDGTSGSNVAMIRVMLELR